MALSALVYLALTLASGAWLALLLLAPGLAPHPALAFGRLHPVHTHLAFYGFLGHGLFLALEPLTRFETSLTRRVGLASWNAGTLGGAVALALGHGFAKEYAEAPLWADALLALGGALVFADLISRWKAVSEGRPRPLVLEVLVPLGLGLPFLLVLNNPPFTLGFDAVLRPYQGQNILGYCLGGYLATALFLAGHRGPRGPLRPSRAAVLGLAASVAVFGLTLLMEKPDGVLAETMQALAVVSSLAMLVPTLDAARPLFRGPPPDRDSASAGWLRAGVVLYLLTALQGTLQFLEPFASRLLFSEWIEGHAHLAVAGSFTAFVLAALADRAHPDGVLVETPAGRRGRRLFLAGLAAMVGALSAAGYLAGPSAAIIEQDDWLAGLRPWWVLRLGAGLVMAWGLVPVLRGFLDPGAPRRPPTDAPPWAAPGGGPWIAGGLGSVLGVALVTMVGGGTGPSPPLDAPARGHRVYVREGCHVCHTRRVVAGDPVFGAPSTREDYAPGLEPLFGTRRLGPDLLRSPRHYTRAWILKHLADPQADDALSPMPGYGHLTEAEAGDLASFLLRENPR